MTRVLIPFFALFALPLAACAEEEEAARERLSPRRSVERGERTR